MSLNGHISLIDLSQQLPFEIDNKLKKEISFGETLVISCGHYEGLYDDESSESEWSCHDTIISDSDLSEDVRKPSTVFEIKDRIEEAAIHEEVPEEDDDFHFFFFSDCNEPLQPQNSDASLILVDGIPQINPSAKPPTSCTCGKDKKGQCICHIKLPCRCGAKTTAECICSKFGNICICDEAEPQPVCICKGSKVCLCDPDGKIRPKCTCGQIDKPCICHPERFPSPICKCKGKPQFNLIPRKSTSEEYSNEYPEIGEYEFQEESEEVKGASEQDPCECQKPDPKPVCRCLKGQDCICNTNACICGVQKSCICEPNDGEEPLCKSEDSKSICSCHIVRECICESKTSSECKCFPEKKCACGNPEKCKCFVTCECIEPCICDTKIDEDDCLCLDVAKQSEKGLLCTCSHSNDTKDQQRKLKRMRAGKHGYRWCHEVDPRHTYFDYGYDRHDKISHKAQEREKLKILGLGNEKEENSDECPGHSVKAPPYKKKVRKPSIDCCSSVGGISISVETLGEDKDKFLIQVVSHASKEGAKTGSKLVSIVDCQLHTMEENRTEFITKKDITKERRSYMTVCENGYYNKVTRVCGECNVVKRFYHSFEDAHNFILEGANIVLLRYFGLRRYRGTVKTETVMMDGTICESIYVCLGVSQAIVNGKPLFVVKVERHIIEPSGLLHQTLTVLTLRGYTVSHEWANNAYMLHINPLLRIIPEKDEIEPHAPLREKWREDLQLLSDYLDFKSTRSSEGARYMAENGTLADTVRDYLQALLLLRPNDVLHFTRHYFGATLSALDLPHDEYFDPTTKHVRYYFFEQ